MTRTTTRIGTTKNATRASTAKNEYFFNKKTATKKTN